MQSAIKNTIIVGATGLLGLIAVACVGDTGANCDPEINDACVCTDVNDDTCDPMAVDADPSCSCTIEGDDDASDNNDASGNNDTTGNNDTAGNNDTTGNNDTANNDTANNDTANNDVVDAMCDSSYTAADACGGTLEGVWNFEGACGADDAIAALEEDLSESCPGVTVDGGATGSGTLTFAAGALVREITAEASVDVSFPSACADAVGGCSALEGILAGEVDQDQDLSCEDTGATCDCQLTGSDFGIGGGAYSVEGDEVVIDGRRWAYCVEGGVLTAREVTDEGEDDFVQVYSSADGG